MSHFAYPNFLFTGKRGGPSTAYNQHPKVAQGTAGALQIIWGTVQRGIGFCTLPHRSYQYFLTTVSGVHLYSEKLSTDCSQNQIMTHIAFVQPQRHRNFSLHRQVITINSTEMRNPNFNYSIFTSLQTNITWIQFHRLKQLGILIQATPGFAYCHGEMLNTLTWRDICIIFQRTNTTAACLATPRVNISQPYSYMTWHQHTPQSFHLKHDTKRTDKEGMWQQFTGCKKQNSSLGLSSNNRLHNVCSYERSFVNLQLSKAQNRTTKCLFKRLNSLLCTVDELVLIGPLEARLHSFVVPQLLCVIKELLRKRKGRH